LRAASNMTLLQQIPDPYLASLVFGLLYGLTFCTSACLPYIVSYIAGIGAGFRKGIIVTSIYNSGRISAYAVLGGVACMLKTALSNTFFISFERYALIVFGIAIILIGLSIIAKKSSSCNRFKGELEHTRINKLTRNFDIRAFSMGFTNGLILCPPLVAVLLYSVTLFFPIDCVVLAVLFGLGTALSPVLLLGGATGWLLSKAPLFSRWISKISGGILILMGLNLLWNALKIIS
jgi:sulfite exporter TauE/SafE